MQKPEYIQCSLRVAGSISRCQTGRSAAARFAGARTECREVVHNLAPRGIYSGDMATTAPSSKLRILGNSDMALTPIGFGAWAIGGGDWQYSWGPQDDKDSIAAIHKAVDMGINWIDTSAIYGLGHSEEVVAKALKTASRKPYVFTKCSLRWRDDKSIYNSLKQASVAEELEASLRRLGVETIDLYQIHWPNPESEIEEGWETLERFRKQGKVRW